MTRNPRDARAGRTRVLLAAHSGDWTRAIAPGHQSRTYSQALQRLKRMGLIGPSGVLTMSGLEATVEAVAAAKKNGRAHG